VSAASDALSLLRRFSMLPLFSANP
jgi:hypothetical protein